MSSAEAADLPKKKKKSNKDYSKVTRVYDSDGYRLRSDALCFKDESKQEVCCNYYDICDRSRGKRTKFKFN